MKSIIPTTKEEGLVLLGEVLAKEVDKKESKAWRGSRLERIASDLLRSMGALVDRAQSTGRSIGGKWVSQTNDRFGCFDIIAMKRNHATLFLQVTTREGARARAKKISSVAPWLTPGECDVEIWSPVVYRESGNAKHLAFRRYKLILSQGDDAWLSLHLALPVPRDILSGAGV